MRRRLLVPLLAALALPSLAAADPCARPGLGLFLDEQATVCDGEPPMFVMTNVHVLLRHEIPDPIARIEFRLENIPDEGPGGIVTMQWLPGIVGQDPEDGMSIVFSPPEEGSAPVLWLGTIGLLPIDPDWIGADFEIRVAEARLWDENEQEYGVMKGHVIFHPTWPVDCFPTATPPPVLRATGFAPRTDEYVGDLFEFSFTAESWECLFGDPLGYAGRIYVEGEQVAEFSGSGQGEHAFSLSAGAVPDDEPVAVELIGQNDDGADAYCRLLYWKSAATGVPELPASTLSALKALYR